MYGFVGELGEMLSDRIKMRGRIQKERAELEVLSYLMSKPPKTKEFVEKKKINTKRIGTASTEEGEYIDEEWSRFEG